jgi:tetratricopeptide (TPR) repeat protein
MNSDARFDQLIADGLDASRQGRTADALALFAQAGTQDPTSSIPPFLIASEQASAGNTEAAEAGFATAVLLAPDFTLARYQLGLLQFSSARAAAALVTWQPLFTLPVVDPLHHFVRGFAALAQDQFDEALAHYRAGLACRDGNPAVASDIAKVIERIEQLRSPQSPAPEPGNSHVLLAGYARSLH